MVNNVKEVRKEPTKVSAMKTKKKRGRDKPKVKGSCSTKRRIHVDEGKHEYETSKTGLPVKRDESERETIELTSLRILQ
jgi:hypothetical protein